MLVPYAGTLWLAALHAADNRAPKLSCLHDVLVGDLVAVRDSELDTSLRNRPAACRSVNHRVNFLLGGGGRGGKREGGTLDSRKALSKLTVSPTVTMVISADSTHSTRQHGGSFLRQRSHASGRSSVMRRLAGRAVLTAMPGRLEEVWLQRCSRMAHGHLVTPRACMGPCLEVCRRTCCAYDRALAAVVRKEEGKKNRRHEGRPRGVVSPARARWPLSRDVCRRSRRWHPSPTPCP